MKQLFIMAVAVTWVAQVNLLADPGAILLTNAAQVRALSPAEAAARRPVHLRGVVTGEGSTGIVIQDSTAGIFIFQSKLDVTWVRRGDLVEIEGVSDPGGFAPVVWPDRITKVGTAPIPEPRWATMDGLTSGSLDAQWVQITGVVRECLPVRLYEFKMILAIGGMRLPVQYFGPTNATSFVDAEVRLTGIIFYQFNRSGQILNPLLMVPGDKYLVVEKKPAADRLLSPLRQPQNVLRFTPEDIRRHRVRVRGIVLYQIPGEALWLHDGGHGLRVETRERAALMPGDEVEVYGFPAGADYTPVLEDATFQKLSPAQHSPAAINVANKSDALNHDADLIRLSARLGDLTRSINGWIMTFNWEGTPLRAVLRQEQGLPAKLEPGSLIQLTGISRVTAEGSTLVGGGPQSPQEFQLLLRSPADLVVLQNPPWWNSRRILFLLTIVTGISLVVAATIVWLARQRLREQDLHRRMAETEFSAMFAERNRIAREIHDTLAQGLGAISMHLELVKDQLGRAPDKVARHLDIAHQMARQSLAEARETIWNMRSQVLENADLAEALQGILKQLTDGTGIQSQFTVTGQARRLASASENNLLRLGQEAITNAVKHSHAKNISVALDFSAAEASLIVRDDGSGFDPTHPLRGGHFGMIGQRERTAQMGGRLEVTSSPDQGTQVKVVIPIYQ